VTLAVTLIHGHPVPYVLYITDNVLSQALPPGFVRCLLRVVTYPGGSPLTDPNSLHLVNRASSYGPAHALL